MIIALRFEHCQSGYVRRNKREKGGEGGRTPLGNGFKVSSNFIPLNVHLEKKQRNFFPSDMYAREWTILLKVTEADH